MEGSKRVRDEGKDESDPEEEVSTKSDDNNNNNSDNNNNNNDKALVIKKQKTDMSIVAKDSSQALSVSLSRSSLFGNTFWRHFLCR